MSLFRLQFANTPLLALIGAAFILRALIPTGWMPTHSTNGFAIELCSPGTMEADAEQRRAARELFQAALGDTSQHKDNPTTAGDQPCTFAGLPHMAPPPSTVEPPAPAALVLQVRPAALVAAIGRGLPAPPPPATGPPLHA